MSGVILGCVVKDNGAGSLIEAAQIKLPGSISLVNVNIKT
jgi:hypothetical protein